MNISIAKIRRSQHLAKAGCKPFEHWKQPMNCIPYGKCRHTKVLSQGRFILHYKEDIFCSIAYHSFLSLYHNLFMTPLEARESKPFVVSICRKGHTLPFQRPEF